MRAKRKCPGLREQSQGTEEKRYLTNLIVMAQAKKVKGEQK